MNKLDIVFQNNRRPLLSLYITAGYPERDSLYTILPALEKAGVDFVEVGIPFSDPMADGEIIQQSSQQALANGMNLRLLFKQLREIQTALPIVLMGYFNPVYQFGIEAFLDACQESGVSGTIIPDLPYEVYQRYEKVFTQAEIHPVFLVTPQTADDRIQELAKHTRGFLYAVSTASVTGNKGAGEANQEYLSRIKKLAYPTPVMIGFGIKNREDFRNIAQFAEGSIIGSRFIQEIGTLYLTNGIVSAESICKFVTNIR